jgi:hypothetical protein
VRLLQKHACTVKFGKDLHAKIFIADRNQAIVTSSNLTNAGLSENAEVGLLIDEPKAVQAVLSTFKKWYRKAGSIGDAELSRLESLQKEVGSQTLGKSYGNFVQDGTASSRVLSHSTDKLGWILIHSKQKYGGKNQYDSPQDQIDQEFKGNVAGEKWHWIWPQPPKAQTGPFKLLLCWQGEIFGEFLASALIRTKKEGHNFAFVLDAYYPMRKIPLKKVYAKPHRGMIKLNKRILTGYEKAASAGKNS